MSLRHSATIITATNAITGLWRGDADAIPVSPTPDRLIVEITEDQYAEIGGKGMNHPQGPPRFVWDGTAIVEQPDSRRRIRFTPDSVDIDVGDPDVTITAEVLRSNGNVDITYTRPRKIVTLGQRRLRLSFLAGVATFTVKAAREHQLEQDAIPEFRLEAPLQIRVADIEIG